ncbi:hypothetical protein LCGC14_2786340, partial [marine sediment metagenome]
DRNDLYSQNAALINWRTNDFAITASLGGTKQMIWDYGNTTSSDSRITTSSLGAFEGIPKIMTFTSRSDNTGEVRINGAVVKSSTILSATITGTSGTLIIGTNASGREYKGGLFKILIYNRSFSADEIDNMEQYMGV